ncbi:hypothetical protein, partial [Streptomyces fragilis]
MACAVVPWFVGEPLLLRLTTAVAAAVGVAAAVTLRRWDAAAGLNVAELKRARASAEWQHEERVAELESDLEEGRELRVKLEQRLRSKRAELAALRNEHASLLRRYATAETERASALEGRRLLELEAADPVPQLPPARETRALGPAPAPEPVSPFSPAGGGLFRQAVEALDSLEALQAAAGAGEGDLDPGAGAVAVAGGEGVVDADADLDADVIGDAGVVGHAGPAADAGLVVDARSAVDGAAVVGEAEEQTTGRAVDAPLGYDAGVDVAEPGSAPAEPETTAGAGNGETAEVPPVMGGTRDTDGPQDGPKERGALGARDTHTAEGPRTAQGAAPAAHAEVTPDQAAPHGEAAPHSSAAAADVGAATDGGVSAAAGPAEEPEARGTEGEPGGSTVSGATTVKPVRPSGGHFTVPTAVAVVPGAPAPRRPAAEGSFDFFGNQRTDHGADGDTGRTADHDRRQPTPAPRSPQSLQPSPAPQSAQPARSAEPP